MEIPIRILLSDAPEPDTGTNWDDVIYNWEDYGVAWSTLDIAPVVDMFDDEGITIKSVVKDLNDPKKLFTEFSRTFTIPATKRNNKIFKHYYNIDITNGLDSRELVPARILMNNATYKVGNILLEGVEMSGGKPMHYRIKFIGKLSELARNIGQDKLASLDFSGENISSFNAKGQFSNNTFRDLCFPLSATSDRFVYDSSQADAGIEGAKNIAYHSNGTHDNYGLFEQDLTGALRVGRIIELIESKYGLNFSGAIDNEYIDELYLWLNKADQNRSGEPLQALATGYSSATIQDVDINNDSIVFTGDNTFAQIRYRIRCKATWTGDAVLKIISDGEVIDQVDTSGEYTNYVNTYANPAVITILGESDSSVTMNVTVQILEEEFDRDYYYGNSWRPSDVNQLTATIGVGTSGLYNIVNHVPDMKVMDFLSSLFKMFNLIAEVDGSQNVTTKHYDHFLSEGVVRDITKYVDADRYQINRPNLYSAMRFEFADSKTALEQGYLRVNGKQYGELGYEIVSNSGSRLSGGEYSLKIENQRIPLEPLINLDSQADTSINYCLFADLKGATQQTAAAFTYVRRVTGQVFGDSSVSFATGTGTDEVTTYIQPSNTFAPLGAKPVESNVKLGLYFGEEVDENNLYNHTNGLGLWRNFYRGLTAQMFDEDKRSARFNAQFSQALLQKMSIADVLKVGNNYYNINTMETNYLTGATKLDLVLVGRAKLPQTSVIQTQLTNDSTVQTLYVTYMNVDGEIIKDSIATGATLNYYSVGGVISYSHDNYSVEGTI